MPLDIVNPSWSSLNAQRRYPLAAAATGRDVTGDFRLPDDFLTWIGLPVQAGLGVEPARFFVKHVGAYGSGYTVVVGYQPLSGPAVNVATALIPAAGFAADSVHSLNGVAPFYDSFGWLTIGRLDSIAQQPPGFWTFDLDGGRLEPDALRPQIRGVSSLTVANAGAASTPLQDDVVLAAGANCRLDVTLDDEGQPTIVVHFLQGEGTSEPCACADDVSNLTPIVRFGGIAPTADGDITIQGSDCIRVEPIPGGLQLIDVCSQPCCGCPELEAITQDLQRLQQDRAVVWDFVTRLQVAAETMSQTVLGSRLSDRTCFSG